MPNSNKTMIEPVHKLKGVTFDRRYLQEIIVGQAKAIAIYKKEAADDQNPALKSYAAKSLPALERHFADARNLKKAEKTRTS